MTHCVCLFKLGHQTLSFFNLSTVHSLGEFVSFLSLFAVVFCRETGFPRSTALMVACHGQPRCENNIKPAGQVAMPERRAWRLNNEGYAS